jgi:hypothetical protein
MTTTKKTSNPAPLAHRVPAEVSATIHEYSLWLSEQCGVKIDPLSVYLGSQLRGTWQKSAERQAELAAEAKARAARDAAKAKARADREAAAAAKAQAQVAADKVAPVKVSRKAQDKINAVMPKPAAKAPARRRPVKGATVATTEGVVVAEQNHIDIEAQA